MYVAGGTLVPVRGKTVMDYLVKPIPAYVNNAFEGFKKKFGKGYQG